MLGAADVKLIVAALQIATQSNPGLSSIYPKRAGVGAGFHYNRAEATPESTGSQDQLIKQVKAGKALA